MKVALLLLAVALSCQAFSDEEFSNQWNSFQVKFLKTYTPLERFKRSSIFRDNLKKIEAHNALYAQGIETYEQGVTQFTDWTEEEFLEYVNKYQFKRRESGNQVFKANSTLKAPASIDWRDKGAVREVKNQGSCGACWSFSATGAMEGLAAIQKNLVISLSEQYLVDCATSAYGNLGCSGGMMDGAFVYAEFYGIDTESNYPYKGVQGTCKPAPKDAFTIDGYVDVEKSETSLQEAVGTIGPVSVGIESTSNLQNYKSGVLYDTKCTGKLNHGVLAVGYGNENGQDYWLIKNSWGASWGESGFFKLARNRGNNCGISDMASYPHF